MMRKAVWSISAAVSAIGIALAPPTAAQRPQPSAAQAAEAVRMLERGVAFRTVVGTPQGAEQMTAYANYLKGILVAAGLPAADVVITPRGETATLVARYRGTRADARPIILSGHMDVVEAVRSDWERDPFVPVVENGYVYGRGSLDNKAGVTVMVATLARLKRDGFRPGRDIILALSGDEETSMRTTRLLARELGGGAELLLNSDAGGGLLGEGNRPLIYGIQAGEKTYADFDITVTNPGGHSSRPGATNAIYDLAQAIDRIAAYRFPAQQNELTRAYFTATAAQVSGDLATAMRRFVADPTDAGAIATLSADPEYVGQVRTTCVATMLRGGHALNALPQSATVSVNCRIFPGTTIPAIHARLAELAGPGTTVKVLDEPTASDASPLRPDVMAALRKAIDARTPGLPIVPHMSAGATDSLYFRAAGVPSYGVGPVYLRPEDDYSHGLNERVPVASIEGGLTEWYVLLTELAK